LRVKDLFNSITQRQIVFYSLLITVLLILLIYLICVIPLADKAKTAKLDITSLQNEFDSHLAQQINSREAIPTSAELTQALDYLTDYLEVNAVTVEEINITQLTTQDRADFFQALIKIRVDGNSPEILRLIGEIIQESRFPFILQELDVGRSTEISLKILYRKTEDL